MNIAVSQPTCTINNMVQHKLHMKLFPTVAVKHSLWLQREHHQFTGPLAMHSNSLTTTAYTRTYTYGRCSAVFNDWVKVLRPTQHKIGHFRDVLSQPISWLSAEETKPNTTKANNTKSKLNQKKTHKMLNLKKNTKTKPKTSFIVKNCSYVCIIVHNCCTQRHRTVR